MNSRPLLLTLALAVCDCALLAADERFGRRVTPPADPAAYEYTKLNGLEVATLRTRDFVVTCLAYEDADRTYVEAGIENQSGSSISVAEDFISLHEDDKQIPRTDTVKEAGKIEAAAIRSFVPTGSKHRATGETVYERDAVERQAREHVRIQERDALFAGLLIANAQDPKGAVIEHGRERSISCTFGPRKSPKAALRIIMRFSGEEFKFSFRE